MKWYLFFLLVSLINISFAVPEVKFSSDVTVREYGEFERKEVCDEEGNEGIIATKVDNPEKFSDEKKEEYIQHHLNDERRKKWPTFQPVVIKEPQKVYQREIIQERVRREPSKIQSKKPQGLPYGISRQDVLAFCSGGLPLLLLYKYYYSKPEEKEQSKS